MNFFVGIFQSFWQQGEKSYFVEHLSVIPYVLLQSKSVFFSSLKTEFEMNSTKDV